MRNTERVSISIDKGRAARIRALVESGAYPNVSAVYDAAALMFLEHQDEMDVWWQEAVRRCDESEKFPERMLDPDTSFKVVASGIGSKAKPREAGSR